MSENPSKQTNSALDSGTALIVFLYNIALSIALVNGLIQIWPATPIPKVSEITYFNWTFTVIDEIQLLLVVLIAGGLGSMIHTVRSFFFWIGKQQFASKFLVWYLLKPVSGSFLAVVFYLVVRAGFLTPSASLEGASPFGFAALAGLVGLFSDEAVEKLKKLAEQVFTKSEDIDDNSDKGKKGSDNPN